jgi:hypothetical protein
MLGVPDRAVVAAGRLVQLEPSVRRVATGRLMA